MFVQDYYCVHYEDTISQTNIYYITYYDILLGIKTEKKEGRCCLSIIFYQKFISTIVLHIESSNMSVILVISRVALKQNNNNNTTSTTIIYIISLEKEK